MNSNPATSEAAINTNCIADHQSPQQNECIVCNIEFSTFLFCVVQGISGPAWIDNLKVCVFACVHVLPVWVNCWFVTLRSSGWCDNLPNAIKKWLAIRRSPARLWWILPACLSLTDWEPTVAAPVNKCTHAHRHTPQCLNISLFIVPNRH